MYGFLAGFLFSWINSLIWLKIHLKEGKRIMRWWWSQWSAQSKARWTERHARREGERCALWTGLDSKFSLKNLTCKLVTTLFCSALVAAVALLCIIFFRSGESGILWTGTHHLAFSHHNYITSQTSRNLKQPCWLAMHAMF